MTKQPNTITLTRADAAALLRNLSAIEGYLWSMKAEGLNVVMETYAVPAVDLLMAKLEENNDQA